MNSQLKEREYVHPLLCGPLVYFAEFRKLGNRKWEASANDYSAQARTKGLAIDTLAELLEADAREIWQADLKALFAAGEITSMELTAQVSYQRRITVSLD